MDERTLPSRHQFPMVMERTINLVGGKIPQEKIRQVAQVFQTLCWDFKDYAIQAYFLVDGDGRVDYASTVPTAPDATITLDARVLHDSAFGRTSLGLAFITGKLRVKGIPALKLNKFVPLLEPFLESYRQAWEEFHE